MAKSWKRKCISILGLLFISVFLHAQITDGLVAHYPLNGNADDKTENGAHGTVYNAGLVNGPDKRAYVFNPAVHSNILISQPAQPAEFPITVSAWIRLDSLPDHNQIIFRNGEWSSLGKYSGIQIGVSKHGNVSATFGSGGGAGSANRKGKNSEYLAAPESWIHIAAVYHSLDSIAMWVDTVEQKGTWAGDATTFGYSDKTEGAIGAGSTEGQADFAGAIDEVMLFDRALTEDEIKVLFSVYDPALLRHYPLDGDVNDVSVNMQDGDAYGADISSRYDVENAAFSFDGTNNITVPSLGNWGDELSISMWFKSREIAESSKLFWGNRGGTSGSTKINMFTALMADSTLRFVVASDAPGEPACISSNKWNPNEWNHVVFEQNRTAGTISIILNGERTSVEYTQDPRYLNLALGFGNWRNGYASEGGMQGMIDDIRIYSKILSDDEIAGLADVALYPNLESVMAAYTFTGDMNDVSGYENHSQNSGAQFTTDRFGNMGNAYAFDGDVSHAVIDTNLVDYNESFSASVWFFPTKMYGEVEGKNNEYMIAHGAHTSAPGYSFIYNSGTIRLINKTDAEAFDSDYIDGVSVDNWHHAVMAYDHIANKTTIWLDGKIVKEISAEGYTQSTSYKEITLGAVRTSQGAINYLFKGKLDDFVLYEQALSDISVQKLYQSGTTNSFPHEDISLCEGDSTLIGSEYVYGAGEFPNYYSDTKLADSLYFVSVEVSENPVVTIDGATVACAGDEIALTASGGNSYAWNTGADTASIGVVVLETATYTVTTTSEAGCRSIDSVIVEVFDNPIVTIEGVTSVCAGDDVSLTASGGNAYTWNTGAETASIEIIASETATYTVTAISEAGCSSVDSVEVTVNDLPLIDLSQITGEVCKKAAGVTLIAEPAGGVFSGTGVSDGIFDPSLITELGEIEIQYEFTTDSGCVASDNAFISVIDCSETAVKEGEMSVQVFPNPTTDGFYIEAPEGGRLSELRVYDANGSLVFYSEVYIDEQIILTSSGRYLITVDYNNKQISKTIVKK